MCYQWQHHTYQALFPIVSRSRCFQMERVGYQAPGAIIAHNWIAITVALGGFREDRARPGECTVYLDPWIGSGPHAYRTCGSEHFLHNVWIDPDWMREIDGLPAGGTCWGTDGNSGGEFCYPSHPW